MLSKLFSKSTIIKLVAKAAKPKMVNMMTVRSFAASKEITVEKGKNKLSKAITREIKYEQENYQPDDTVNVINHIQYPFISIYF